MPKAFKRILRFRWRGLRQMNVGSRYPCDVPPLSGELAVVGIGQIEF